MWLYVLILALLWLWHKFNYWKQFPQVNTITKSPFAILYQFASNWRLSSHMMQLYATCRLRNWACVGSYLFTRPLLFVGSNDLLKEVVVEHQLHFRNRGSYYGRLSEEANLNLFNRKDDDWEKWRKVLIRCFTVTKLKQYLTTFEHFIDFEVLAGKEIDFFKVTNRYAYSAAQYLFLGVDNGSMGCDDSTYDHLKNIFKPSCLDKLGDILGYYAPCVLRFFNRPEFPKMALQYATDAVRKSLQNESFEDLPSGCMPRQLLEMQKDCKLSTEGITGALAALFLGGLKSTTPMLTYTCYELAKAPKCQDKLRNDILDALNIYGSFTYEALQSITYLQQVLEEIMRMYNGGPLLIRECNETCTLQSNGLVVEKGVLVVASLRGMLMDEEFFPEPDKFNPERFNVRSNIPGFLPFGLGGHTCIGNKLALVQAKLFMAMLLAKYRLVLSDRTTQLFTDKNERLADNQIFLDVTPLNA